MCSPSNPVTEWLFGDDLSKKVKDMTEVNKVGQRVSHRRQFDKSRYNPLEAGGKDKNIFSIGADSLLPGKQWRIQGKSK